MIRKLSTILLAISAILAIGTTKAHAQYVFTNHHVIDIVHNNLPATGRLAESQMMTLDVVLPIADQSALDQFLSELYDPNSPSYHHYLTPAEFTAWIKAEIARWGPVVQASGFVAID